MKRLLTRLESLLCCAMALLCCAVALPALAAGPALPQATVERLQGLERQLEAGSDVEVGREARAQAARLDDSGAEGWAKALYLQLAAHAEARRGRDGEAADLLAQARDLRVAPLAQRVDWLEQEAKLRLRAGQDGQGTALLERWAGQASPQVADLWLLAQLQAHRGDWSAAARWLARARQATAALSAEQTALAATIYQHAGDDQAAVAMVEAQLDRDARDPQMWRRAAALYQRIGEPGRAAALWEAGWRSGVLQGTEALVERIALHMAGGTPARAAEILAQALAQGELEDTPQRRRQLAQAWTQARAHDKALAAWRELARRTDAADDWRQLGELAYGWGEWSSAIEGLRRARQAGAAQDGRLWLLEGVAAFEQGDLDAARHAFGEAANSAEVAAQAEAWQKMVAQSDASPRQGNG